MPNVFEQAYSAVDTVEELVVSRVEDARETAMTLQVEALETIAQLRGVGFVFNGGPLPEPPRLDSTVRVDLDLPVISPTSFGSVTFQPPDRPTLVEVEDLELPEIPDFVASIHTLSIPQPPAWSAPGAEPEEPELDAIILPDDPTLVLPAVPTLDDLAIPTFDGLTIPTFDDAAPEFTGTELPTVLQWAEPTYNTEILDEAFAEIRRLWAGGSGIPEAVERAMVERAQSREDEIAAREIDAVSEEFSSRGFTMPTGMQAARVDALRQALAVKKLGLNRDLTIKFAEAQIENVRFGITQALGGEQLLINIFENSANRVFEAAKFRVESQLRIYDAQVALFNARMNAFQIRAQVFDIRVRAALSELEIFKAEIEAALARGQLNQQRVQIYTAQVQAVQTGIEVFKAQMQGAEIQSGVQRNRIEAYRARVQAYAERIAADKVRFDAYAAQVAAESAKAGIIESEARAYAALVAGKTSVVDLNLKRLELRVQKNQQNVTVYAADLEAEKTRMQSQLSTVQAAAQAYTADTQRFSAAASAETAKAQLEISAKETELRSNISFYQAKVQAYLGLLEQMIRQATLSVDSVKAAGQLLSTLAAGAMAGVHVGASLSGGGAVNASGAYSDSDSRSTTTQTSTSTSTTTNYNYEGT